VGRSARAVRSSVPKQAAPTDPTRSARAHLVAFVELSAQIFCVTDFTGAVVWCNAALERALGYGPGELVGVRLWDLVHPEDSDRAHEIERALLANDEMGTTEIRLRARDGGWRLLEWTTRIDRTRRRVYGAAHDITGRREDEAALSDSAARLQAILKHSPSVIFVKDLDGRYLMVNDEFERFTGVPVDRVPGLRAEDCWPMDAGTVVNRERELTELGVSLTTDETMHTLDGPRDFMVSRFLLRDEGGTPYAIGGIATDITERLRAEKALATRDQLLGSVIKASPDMITLLDDRGRIHQISEAGSALFGYRYEDFTQRDLFDFVHPDDRDDVASVFVRMATGALPHLHLRYRMRHADGHWVTVDSRAQAVLDADGRFAGAVVVSRDITEKLEAEHRLQASREAVEQASRAKSEFLSRMSHELRTPLNSILGFAQLLQMDDLPAPQADAVEHILRAGRHLLDLIDEVLDIARIESGHLELTLTPVRLAEIVSEAVDLTNPMATRADVVIRTAFAPRDGFVVTADRQRLMQVLLNVLSNAVKYNRPGGRIEVTCEPIAPRRLRLSIADTGRGIRPEDLDRVFVPFDRLGVEQTGIEGTGVGLALSKHLCERMGGSLGVDSVHEVGSTFFVDLPAADLPPSSTSLVDPGSPHRPARTPGADDTDPRGRGVGTDGDPSAGGRVFRVLLVEDNLTTLDLVERVLSRRPGTEVLAAMQGGLGADLAREHQPDLILLDLQLPDMTGSGVLDRLAEDAMTSGIPVAVVGADASPQQVRQLLGRGVIGFLAKPIDVRGLLSLVDAVRAARGA
jgi:PAS domain S-box-containing protein